MTKLLKPFPVKFVIYYRDMPDSVLSLLKEDSQSSLVKDGLKKMTDQIDAPRLTLTLLPVRKDTDKTRYIKTVSLLDGLLKRDEILDYKIL
jgi:ribosomal protein L7Ae-like RNA K-turn-binding protein